jgi:hypothetical protein
MYREASKTLAYIRKRTIPDGVSTPLFRSAWPGEARTGAMQVFASLRLPTSQNVPYAHYDSPSLQGFEAIGSVLRWLVRSRVYQAVLRQSIKLALRV